MKRDARESEFRMAVFRGCGVSCGRGYGCWNILVVVDTIEGFLRRTGPPAAGRSWHRQFALVRLLYLVRIEGSNGGCVGIAFYVYDREELRVRKVVTTLSLSTHIRVL